MSEKTNSLKRRWMATRSQEDEIAYLLASIRASLLSPEVVKDAAKLGYKTAQKVSNTSALSIRNAEDFKLRLFPVLQHLPTDFVKGLAFQCADRAIRHLETLHFHSLSSVQALLVQARQYLSHQIGFDAIRAVYTEAERLSDEVYDESMQSPETSLNQMKDCVRIVSMATAINIPDLEYGSENPDDIVWYVNDETAEILAMTCDLAPDIESARSLQIEFLCQRLLGLCSGQSHHNP